MGDKIISSKITCYVRKRLGKKIIALTIFDYYKYWSIYKQLRIWLIAP